MSETEHHAESRVHTPKQITLVQAIDSLSKNVIVLLASLIIGVSIIIHGTLSAQSTPQAPVNPFNGPTISAEDVSFGNTKSDTVVMLYSDPQCPYCITLSDTYNKLVDTYKDRVHFVYRHYPLTQIHPEAMSDSLALHCAYTLKGADGFLAYFRKVYGTQLESQQNSLGSTTLERFASEIGIDSLNYRTCVSNPSYSQLIMQDQEGGQLAGVDGTPSIFILKKDGSSLNLISKIDGARKYQVFQTVLDNTLK